MFVFGVLGEPNGIIMPKLACTHDLDDSFWIVVPNGDVDNVAKFHGNWVCLARGCFEKCK